MARLIVKAVPNETTGSDLVFNLQVYVSVSRADDGRPVTSLTKENFRISSSIGGVLDPKPSAVHERHWEPGDTELSGCYSLSISRGSAGEKWFKGEYYAFGIQVTVNERNVPVHFGQTVVSVLSQGT
ncbi:MAG TPA: hypothetical protein VMW27_22390 [Thermoanaerobaculia bacterium]|nr:hypothetical protein [Thermoanaerobaculia bacterium]